MKIIYLHDPKAGASVLPQLEETFPMLEIVAIDLEDDFEMQFEALKALFSQISYRNYYAIVADGFGIAYASFFRNTWTKGPHPTITILLNPNYRAIKDCDTYKKIPKRVSLGYEEDCLKHLFGSISIFTYENYHLLAYHQQHYGGDYLVLFQSTVFMSIKDLIDKSATGSVTINYLKTPILTPRGQILPPDYPLISVNGSFEWFGEKLFNFRIPSSAFTLRAIPCIGPSRLYLLKGDVIANELDATQIRYKYLGDYIFLDIDTGDRIEGHQAPFASWGFPGVLPDWNTIWTIQECVMYKICVPFSALKNPSKGYDKYGNEFKVKANGNEAILLWRENMKNGALKKNTTSPKEECVAGVFPNNENPKQIYLLPYGYEGIMVFKSTSKIKSRLALKIAVHCPKSIKHENS